MGKKYLNLIIKKIQMMGEDSVGLVSTEEIPLKILKNQIGGIPFMFLSKMRLVWRKRQVGNRFFLLITEVKKDMGLGEEQAFRSS